MSDNYYQLSLKLLKPRKEYFLSAFTESSTKKYFNESLDEIHSFLQERYENNYLFASVAYAHDNRIKTLPHRFNKLEESDSSNSYCGQYMEELINYLSLYLVNEKRHLSFTQVMLSAENHQTPAKILLYDGESYGSRDYKPEDLIEFDLSRPKWSKLGCINKFKSFDFANHDYGSPLYTNFLNNDGNPFLRMTDENPSEEIIEEFNRLVSMYIEINACFGGNNYFYFIKPQSSHNEFGGVLLLGLKQLLPIDDFTMWVHIFYRILSEIAIKRLQEAEKKVHFNYIFGIGHFLKHRISPIIANLVKANEDLTKIYGISNELQNSISLSRTALFSASALDLYGKALQKRLTKKDYTEFSEDRINGLQLTGTDGEIIQNTLKHYYLNDKDLNIGLSLN